MTKSERSSQRLGDLCYSARLAVGKVPGRAHRDYASLLEGESDEKILNVLVSQDSPPSVQLVSLSVGGEINSEPLVFRMPIYDGRFVEAEIVDLNDPDADFEQNTAKIIGDGSVVYNGEDIISEYPKMSEIFYWGRGKREKIRRIVGFTQTGLAIASFVEQNVALSAKREPQLKEIDQASTALTEYFGEEVPLEKNIATILPRGRI